MTRRAPFLLLALSLAAPSLVACEEETVLLGADLCAASDCGSELAVPSRSCVDGTTGGYTGRCMRDEAVTACHWEIVDCPPAPECQPADCGTFPTAYTASADEAVECRREADGGCHWTVMELPGCEPADCGPAPEAAAAMICPGGELGGFTGQCIVGPAGDCVWEVATCPEPLGGVTDAACSLEECGQQPPDARIACADGTAAGNTGRCVRSDATGSCGWEVLDCAAPVECAANDECALTEFCDRSAVACNMGIRGMCSLRPTECPTYVDGADRRVCACDGLTYDSACAAQILGVSVAYDGPCT
ncbi:MAG: hypothetical protein K1X94_04745 [Sandaracinaceae bacterium]|nr:hypothetical protein [Sandaracinaceae bacterium]